MLIFEISIKIMAIFLTTSNYFYEIGKTPLDEFTASQGVNCPDTNAHFV